MYTHQHQEEFQYDLDKPRIALVTGNDCSSIKHNLTQSPFSTLYLRYVLRKWYTWRLEKSCTAKCINLEVTVLTPNLYHGRQDLFTHSAKTSADHQSKRSEGYEETRSAKFEETRSGNVDSRIQGLPHSTDQKEDYDRWEVVKNPIHQFDTHPNRDSLMEDLNKTEKFNPFSEKSKKLITSMGNTEYFELCSHLFSSTMPWLFSVLWSWHRILHLRQTHAAVKN